jgi:hypothetical protein
MDKQPNSNFARSLPVDADQAIALWADITDASEELLLAGLRRQIGPNGDLKAAYRRWYDQYTEEHDRAKAAMLRRLAQAEKYKTS